LNLYQVKASAFLLVPGNTEADAHRIANDALEAIRFQMSALSSSGVPVLVATLTQQGKLTALTCDNATLEAMLKQPDLFGEPEEGEAGGGGE